MQNISKKRHIIVMLTVIAMLFTMVTPMGVNVEAAENDTVLTVYDGSTVKKTFTNEEISAITTAEGIVTYNFSRSNNYGTIEIKEGKGPTVDGIISEAGIDVNDYASITFVGGDGVTTSITTAQYLEERYYYPNALNGSASLGKAGDMNSRENKEIVPAIINTEEKNALYFGQIAPNEQNAPVFNKGMIDGGKIIFQKSSVSKNTNDLSFKDQENAYFPGEAIQFESKSGILTKKATKIYFTTDGTEPTKESSAVYNYNTYSDPFKFADINAPNALGEYEIKLMVTEFGKNNSDVVTLKYKTIQAPATVTGIKASAASYNSAKISWSKVTDADGYAVYSSTSKNGAYSRIATVAGNDNTSYVNTKIKTGKKYYYKVAAYKGKGAKIGSMSSAVSIKTALSKPKKLKAKAKGKKKIVITANKVKGANGYVVYRSTKKNKGFKKIKTVKKTSLKFTDKKVKSGKKYYYKIKAYRTVDKKKVYSAYSVTVARRAK